jgi:hypothetical protein
MTIRLRKLVGAILLIALVVTWALLAMALAQSAVVKGNGLIEVSYYVVAGLGWVLVRKVAQLGAAWLVQILCDRLVVAAREQTDAFSRRLGRLADNRVPLRGTA